MFTGIVTDVGRVREVVRGGDTRFVIGTGFPLADVPHGASIACAGTCLTVVDKGDAWFAANASAETLACTTLGGWTTGTRVNLERPLRVGDELGGHMVTGHVDGIATISEITPDGDSRVFTFEAPDHLAPYVAAKGSVALDGASLTVNSVQGRRFTVNLIPHTLAATTFGERAAGESVNMEIDILARYVARLMERE